MRRAASKGKATVLAGIRCSLVLILAALHVQRVANGANFASAFSQVFYKASVVLLSHRPLQVPLPGYVIALHRSRRAQQAQPQEVSSARNFCRQRFE